MDNKFPSHVPESVMLDSADRRLKYFLEKTILHRCLDLALRETRDAILNRSGPDLVIISGPTGVGKTTMAARLESEVAKHYEPNRRYSPGMIPVVRLSAVTTGSQGFCWKDFYIRLLCRLDRTNPQFKLDFGTDPSQFGDEPFQMAKTRLTVGGYERTIESSLRCRDTKLLLIDEANQIITGCRPTELRRRFEVIKSLSIETGVSIGLVGTYDLLEIRDQSAQLVRRSKIVHLPRYKLENPVDREAFGSALQTFGAHMPFQQVPNLVDHFEYFYLKSAGCVGILKLWLNEAVEAALKQGLVALELAHIERYAMENRCVQTILEEAFAGERKLAEVSLDALKSMMTQQHIEVAQLGGAAGIDKYFGTPRQRRRPGQRTPKRDPIGQQGKAPEATV